LEYRCLSAAMYANESLMKVVWNGIIQALDAFNRNRPLPSSSIIRKAIDESNIELATEIINKYGVLVGEYPSKGVFVSKFADLEL